MSALCCPRWLPATHGCCRPAPPCHSCHPASRPAIGSARSRAPLHAHPGLSGEQVAVRGRLVVGSAAVLQGGCSVVDAVPVQQVAKIREALPALAWPGRGQEDRRGRDCSHKPRSCFAMLRALARTADEDTGRMVFGRAQTARRPDHAGRRMFASTAKTMRRDSGTSRFGRLCDSERDGAAQQAGAHLATDCNAQRRYSVPLLVLRTASDWTRRLLSPACLAAGMLMLR